MYDTYTNNYGYNSCLDNYIQSKYIYFNNIQNTIILYLFLFALIYIKNV